MEIRGEFGLQSLVHGIAIRGARPPSGLYGIALCSNGLNRYLKDIAQQLFSPISYSGQPKPRLVTMVAGSSMIGAGTGYACFVTVTKLRRTPLWHNGFDVGRSWLVAALY